LKRLKPESAIDEIERGFAAVALAAGQPIAPFFRFPGLNDNAAMLTHLQGRKVASFTVDVISNDSYIHDSARLVEYTLAQVEARKGGIVLFHDIKAATARALPIILGELKARGYTVVHMRSTAAFEPAPGYDAQLAPMLAKAEPATKGQLIPFYAAALRPDTAVKAETPEVTITPEAATYVARANEAAPRKAAAKKPLVRTASSAQQTGGTSGAKPRRPAPQGAAPSGWPVSLSSGWVTTIAPPRLRRSAVD
jgi:peptidoglycan-N-acetylglucosamine deacetylase